MAKELMSKVTNNDNLRRYVHRALSKINKSSSGGGMSPEEVEAYVEQALTQFGSDLMTVNKQSLLGPGNIDACMFETTWQELKDARDNGELIPGALYRITDYVTTTVQENTRSAGHQFDVIVQAISESVLSEDAKAIQHKFEMPEKGYSSTLGVDGTLEGTEMINGILYYVYTFVYDENIPADKLYIDINNCVAEDSGNDDYPYQFYVLSKIGGGELEDNGDTLLFAIDVSKFSYFSNSNLAAWKLKYCLDNDTNRFAWAQQQANKGIILDMDPDFIFRLKIEIEGDYQWVSEEYNKAYSVDAYLSTTNKDPEIGETIVVCDRNDPGNAFDRGKVESIVLPIDEGKGVIYQMIDEHNNDCPYDFKNIQFLRSEEWQDNHPDWTDNAIDAIYQDVYFYTFSLFSTNGSTEDVSVIPKATSAGTGTVETANNNTILPYVDENIFDGKLYLNDIILIVTDTYDSDYHLPKFNTFRYHCKNISLADEVENNTFNGYIYDFCSCGIFISNTVYSCMGLENAGSDIDSKIIYTASGTIYVKSIDDAFSGT